MEKGIPRFSVFFVWLSFLCLVLLSFPAFSQDEEFVSYEPITKVDLGVTSLNLAVGESYTFDVSFEPADTILRTLDWYVTDESVVRIDPLTDTVTALANGEARIFAESFDQFSYAVCTVTVGDSAAKDASVMKSGSDYLGLSPQDMKKVSAETLIRYLDFIADSALDESSYEAVSARVFDVIAAVKPGKEEAQSLWAKGCGVDVSEPLRELNAVTLIGSVDAILKYAEDNPDLIEIFEFGPFEIEDPIAEEVSEESIQKTVGLRGATQELTSINFAQNTLGLTGKGRWIAVIDSGINYKNAQFSGNRQIIEKCFSKTEKYKSFSTRSVCSDGSEKKGASAPSLAWNKTMFDHGSHVTGIAAGRDGIAPLANIISVQTHSEKVWTCKDPGERKAFSCGSGRGNQCCTNYMNNSDLSRAYDYLISLAKTRKITIDAVNMSYGESKKYTGTCDEVNKWEKNYFDKMVAAGMLPVVAAGNQGFDGGLHVAACFSNAYVVGGLMDKASPLLRKSSSHSPKVDITAPGTNIYSAGYSKSMMTMSGTSMATPMVTGAVALLKQMYPGMTSEDAGIFLKSNAEKTVNKRTEANWSFKYNKPVLSFGRFHWVSVPYYSWTTGGNKSVTIKTYRMNRDAKFSAEVTSLTGQKITGVKVQWKSEGDFTYIKVSSPNMQNGHIYNIKLTRTFNIGAKKYSAWRMVYGRPVNTASAVPQATAVNGGVTLTSAPGEARYFIYDQATGKLVKRINVKDGSKPNTVTGLINGRLYSVSAISSKTVMITKKGSKRDVNFYSQESARAVFMPMSIPFNAKVTYPPEAKPTFATVSCTADSGVTGVKIFYRKSGTTGNWEPGCTTSNGQFTCQVKNTGRGYDFLVQKYKVLNGKTYTGPSVEVKGR